MARSKPPAAGAAPATVFVLQGGGALGSYQAGAFEALAAHAGQPDWVAGISIGAINAALIAGNPPGKRVARLRTFWEQVTSALPPSPLANTSELLRSWGNDFGAAWTAAFGLPGFFTPRIGVAAWPGTMPTPSIYDTARLRDTLLELVDFDRLNDGAMRLSVGAVDVESGNFAYFDTRDGHVGPEHIMASGALPPSFPAIAIDGHAYWDGGLVSNTPLRHVVEHVRGGATTIFQVDLFSARGALPRTLAEVDERGKDIRFSSRTRAVTDLLRERYELYRRIRALAAMLPAARRATPEVRAMLEQTDDAAITLVHLIRRHTGYETHTKDYEFSRDSMLGHWQAGLSDMQHSLRALAATPAAEGPCSFRVFDFHGRGGESGARRETRP